MGFGVEQAETYLAVLERRLLESGQDVSVANAGVTGYNLRHSFHYLTGAGIELDPDLIILQVWVGDDLHAGGAGVPAREASTLLKTKMLARYSYLSMFVRDRFRANRAIRGWLLEHNMLVRYNTARFLTSDLTRSRLEKLESLLVEYKEFCVEHDVRLVILLLPIKEQIYEEYWQRTLEYNLRPVDVSKVDFDAPNRLIRQMAEEKALELIDVTERFRDDGNKAALFFDIDVHLTAAGNQVVGDELFEYLKSEMN